MSRHKRATVVMRFVRASVLGAAIASGAVLGPSRAMITEVKAEPIHLSTISCGLDAVINHKTRVYGRIGPLGPTAVFEYNGDAKGFNEVLALYAKTQQGDHILYLNEQAASGFSVSVTGGGDGFLHLPVGGGIDLSEIIVPKGVNVEYLPTVGLPTNPELQKRAAEAKAKIDKFIAARAP
jgi:hypothetical protein